MALKMGSWQYNVRNREQSWQQRRYIRKYRLLTFVHQTRRTKSALTVTDATEWEQASGNMLVLAAMSKALRIIWKLRRAK